MFINKEKHVFVMDKNNQPVERVALPCNLTFETLDCFSEQIKCSEDTIATLNFDRVNPATGPVYLEGIKAGDVIAINICDIRIKSPGKMVAAPGAGVLASILEEAETMMVPIEDNKATFKNLQLPLNPMMGVIGVAPKDDPIPCGVPHSHGGNMDTKLIATGSTLYLPVQVDGGLIAIGDLHAAMGDGEIMVSGVEVSGEVDVTITKAENVNFSNPVVKTDKELAIIASAETLDEAIEIATIQMARFLETQTELSLNEAGMLMSACGNAQISQIVDPLKTARFSMPIDVLRKLGVFIAF
ncbi:amidase [Desulfitispora alkaliphila]|uniref:acetamidase/formamidase family protein n=1 Tax=Desulfitispora alkaliphila TaxID=622674 RepID=UPI003D243A78